MTDQQQLCTVGIKRRATLIEDNNDDTLRRNKPFSSTTQKKKNKKSVNFAPTCDITFIERIDLDKIDASELWWTDDDHRVMRQNQVRSINTLILLLSNPSSRSARGSDPTNDEKVLNIMHGIEGLLLSKEVKACKNGCMDAVLEEQERQDDLGIFDPDRLARASRKYSRFAMRRAQKIGMQQSR